MNNNLLATIIAFYLSKFNDLALKKLGYKTYKDAFMECGRLIDVKPNYIKLRRDEFDPVYNWRKGWRNRPMAKMVSNIIMLFDDLAEPEMLNIESRASETILNAAKDLSAIIDNKTKIVSKELDSTSDKVNVRSVKEDLVLISKKQVITQSGTKKIKLS